MSKKKKAKQMSGPEFIAYVMNKDNDPDGYKPSLDPESENYDPYLAAEAEASTALPALNWEVRALAAGRGVRKRADMTPDERKAHDNAKAASRARKSRRRKERQQAAEVIAEQPLNHERMRAGLVILTEMHPLISKVVHSRYSQMRRVLGDISAYDVAQDVLMGAAEGIARQDEYDLVDLLLAARWLNEQPGIPTVVVHEAPAGSKWLMSVIQRQTTHRMADAYRNSVVSVEYEEVGPDGEKEVVRVCQTLESLDYLETVLANTGGIDSLISKTKADRSPWMVGSRFPAPGAVDRTFVGMAIDAAIAERELDWLTDLILDEDNLRTDGAFMWTAHYKVIWAHLQENLPWLPDLPGDNERQHVVLVRRAVASLFEYLPEVIAIAYGLASDPAAFSRYTRGMHVGDREWVPAQAFDMDDAEDDIARVPDGSSLLGSGALAEVLSNMDNGLGYVLETADKDDPQMTYFANRPDGSEWSRVSKIEPGESTCSHGQRQSVYGKTKKAHKHPRPWMAEMCALGKDAPDACPPVFHGKPSTASTIVVEHVTPTQQRIKKAKKALQIIQSQEA